MEVQKSIWRKRCYLGLLLMGIALLMPLFLNVHNFQVLFLLEKSILHSDGAMLIYTSARLVFLNTLRALPLYLGAFLLAQGISFFIKQRLLAILLPLALIPLVYQGIDLIHGIEYDFGFPAVLNAAHVLFLAQMVERLDHSYKKLVVVSLFLFGVQWLDVAPVLSGFGFGRGEISLDVKSVAAFLETGYILNLIAILFATTLILNSILVTKFMVDQYRQTVMFQKNQEQEKKLQTLKVQAVRARSLLEVQQLAHDLKNPLTIIQGLASLLSMMFPGEEEKTSRISRAADHMGSMISEILYADRRRPLPLKELMYFIQTQLLPRSEEHRLILQPGIPDLQLWANKVRLSRALVNVIENGFKTRQDGTVVVEFQREGCDLLICIHDNGPGVAPEIADVIWEAGFSTRPGATGLGLSFAREVIQSHNGQITVESQVEKGASFIIRLPIYAPAERGKEDGGVESTDYR